MYAIAAELGVSHSTLTRPSSGERVPPLELVCRVATAAGLRVTLGIKGPRRKKKSPIQITS